MRAVYFLLTLFFVSNLYAQELIIDKVIATVGDELVLLSEVEQQYAYESERAGGQPEEAKCGYMEKIMLSKLLNNQAKLDSVIVSEDEIEAQLEQRIDYILGLMNNDIQQFEEYYGKGVAAVRNEMRESQREQMTAERMQAQVLAGTTITPSEVKAYYNLIPRDSLPYFSSEVEIGEIVVPPVINDIERQAAIDELTSLKEQIEGGASLKNWLASIQMTWGPVESVATSVCSGVARLFQPLRRLPTIWTKTKFPNWSSRILDTILSNFWSGGAI